MKLKHKTTINMAHLGARAFDEIGGEVVQTTAFVNHNSYIENYKGTYARLVDTAGENEKKELFLSGNERHIAKQENFSKIPGHIISYWLSEKTKEIFENEKRLYSFGNARQGLATTDNKLYLRLWFEVNYFVIDFECSSCTEIILRKSKWFPYNKAGNFRKWSSINEYVVNYENDGKAIKESVMRKYPYLKTPGFVVKNTDTYFKHGITWNDVATGMFCCRYVADGYIYDAAGPMFFSQDDLLMLAYFNSSVFQLFADIICQGLHYSTGHIPEIPYKDFDEPIKSEIRDLSNENITLSKTDWDSFETSWDFKKHPLI